MAKFFDKFPLVAYDIAGKQYSNYQNVTNIFFRFRIIRSVMSHIGAYYEHLIRESETPEIIAQAVYGDVEAHWIILFANDMIDPQYDWPLPDAAFKNYIIDKYGSIANAKTTYHHYEKVVQREQSSTGIVTERRFVVNKEKLTNNNLSVPYDYYQGTGSLPETQELNTYNLSDNTTVVETISRNAVTNFDYEYELNEAKRNIKIIKPEYYPQIQTEIDRMTDYSNVPYIRRLVY